MLIADDVGRVERGENADLVEGVLLLLVRKIVHLHFLERVDLGVSDTLHLVDRRIRTLA